MYPDVRIVIADDQPRAREALKAVLVNYPAIQVVGEAVNGREVVELVDKLHPDAVLMDVCTPAMNGLETTRQIKFHWPYTRIVVLTMYAGERTQALKAGADAFLLKGESVEHLLQALTTAALRDFGTLAPQSIT